MHQKLILIDIPMPVAIAKHWQALGWMIGNDFKPVRELSEFEYNLIGEDTTI